jgi:hypothetical protein
MLGDLTRLRSPRCPRANTGVGSKGTCAGLTTVVMRSPTAVQPSGPERTWS